MNDLTEHAPQITVQSAAAIEKNHFQPAVMTDNDLTVCLQIARAALLSPKFAQEIENKFDIGLDRNEELVEMINGRLSETAF